MRKYHCPQAPSWRPGFQTWLTAYVDRSDGHSVVVAAQGCVAPVLRSYLQTDYAIFKVQYMPSPRTSAVCGKNMLVAADRTKTKSSMRTLPLVPFMKERLLQQKKVQAENRKLCGRSYVKDYLGYVCVNEIGAILKPNYISTSFPKLLENNGLRHIRFHDLRHSCASLMLANGVAMKQIQEWLGHSDFSTTANIYAHLDYSSKLHSADVMLSSLGLEKSE